MVKSKEYMDSSSLGTAHLPSHENWHNRTSAPSAPSRSSGLLLNTWIVQEFTAL